MLELVAELRTILGEKTASKFGMLVKSLNKRGDVEDPEAVAASIGRKKYGYKKMNALAARGKRLAKD